MEKIRGASVYGQYLEEHLDYSDYVGEKEAVLGEWFGHLAEELGMQGPCNGSKDTSFRALCDGLHPGTREQLTQYHRDDGIRFFDFQCSAVKSVSIMAVTMGDARLIQAHKASVKVGLAELEKFAAYRSGKSADSRIPEITGNLVGALFTHTSARPDSGGGPADPQLHTHCAVANVTRAADGKFYALTEIEMLRAIRYGGKAYESEMARRVAELGYGLQLKHGPNGAVETYELAGIPAEVQERFSKRSAAVEKAAAEFAAANGRAPTVGELRVIKRNTRGDKDPTLSNDAMVAKQRAQLSQGEFRHLEQQLERAKATASRQEGPTTALISPAEAISGAVAHLYERESVVPRHAILAETLGQNLGRLNLHALQTALVGHQELVPLTEAPETLAVKVATVAGLTDELRALQSVRTGSGAFRAYVDQNIFKAFGGLDDVELRGKNMNVTDQRHVADQVLASTDRYLSIRGVAGAGKTTVLNELHKGLRAGEWHPLYLAPTASARDVLKGEGFNAATLQHFVAQQNNPDLRLPFRSVLVVDEAGLTSNRLGLAVMRAAENDGARVIFVGDTKQHPAVEAGDFVRILEEHGGIQQFTLGKIQRQQREEYRAAMQEAARGNSRAAVERLDAIGWVKEGKGTYLVNAAKEYVDLRGRYGSESVLGISPTHAEGRAMTDIVRGELKTRGELGAEQTRRVFDSFDWTAQQRRNVDNYAPGQHIAVTIGRVGPLRANETATVVGTDPEHRNIVVEGGGKTFRISLNAAMVERFQVGKEREIPVAIGDALLVTRNHKPARLVNGEILTVESMQPDGGIRTTAGKTIPEGFAHLSHGYVITAYKSQGRTVDHVVVAADALGAKAAYVSLTRGRHTAVLHTAEKEHLYQSLPPVNVGRPAAIDLRKPPESISAASARRTFWHRTIRQASRLARSAKVSLSLVRRYFYEQRTQCSFRPIHGQGTTKVF